MASNRKPVISTEMFRDMSDSYIPPYNSDMPFSEQTDDVKQFWESEFIKLKYGITINGTFFHPWLYWYLNFWHIMVDLPNGDRIMSLPELRDNEWLFQDCLKRAEKEKKGIIMFGTRRYGKALANNERVYTRNGAIPIGSITKGTHIYGEDGELHEVTAVYPQGVLRTYRVIFDDGREVCCCENHLWEFEYEGKKQVKPLKEIFGLCLDKVHIPLGKGIGGGDSFQGNPEKDSDDILNCLLMGRSIASMVYSVLGCSYEYRAEVVKHLFRDGDVIDMPVGEEIQAFAEAVVKLMRSVGVFAWLNEGGKGWRLYADKSQKTMGIEAIYPDKFTDCTCITVDNPSGLFLTSNYIVTHNTAIIASFVGFNATMTKNLDHDVTGFSNGDLKQVGIYLKDGLNNMCPFLKLDRPSDDWNKGVVLGRRNKKNELDVHARINIYNVNQGKTQASKVSTAGSTQKTFVFDEVGKGPFLDAFHSAKPGFDTLYGWRCVPILSGTGGNIELSLDAQRTFNNPEAENLILMDWDLLNRRTSNPTWKQRKCGIFVPGQLSHSQYVVREKIPLGKYLGKRSGVYDLNKIIINASNFDKSTENFKKYFDSLENKDKKNFSAMRMAYPLDPDDCFLKSTSNDFPVEAALSHKNDLIESGDTGIYADVFQKDNLVLGFNESTLQEAPYPFSGGIWEAPVKIYELPQSNNFQDFIYTCGLDPYKHTKSAEGTKDASLGSFYVYKRLVGINDKYANSIVASYVARPSSMDKFCRVCEILQEGYGAVCLQENADIMYQNYLASRSKEAALLAVGDEVTLKYNTSHRMQANRFGINPTPANQSLMLGLVIQYCNEVIIDGYNEDGTVRTHLGVKRIKDIQLLEEIINFDPRTNHDRIIAFGHALLLGKYYDDMHYMPQTTTQRSNEELLKAKKEHQMKHLSPFTKTRRIFK